MAEAYSFRMSLAFRSLSATSLLYGEVAEPQRHFDEYYVAMTEDYAHQPIPEGTLRVQALIRDLDGLLEANEKTTADFNLPVRTHPNINEILRNPFIMEERSIPVSAEDFASVKLLTPKQRESYDAIMGAVQIKTPVVFFIDGPARAGKTFLYCALLAKARSEDRIVLTTASSGIAAILMPGGRTAHSRFKIPMKLEN